MAIETGVTTDLKKRIGEHHARIYHGYTASRLPVELVFSREFSGVRDGYHSGAAGLINAGLGFYLVRKGKRHKAIILVANGKHVLTDSWTSAL
ncbi:MAG: hypothetical protein O7D34_00740 [Ignavibacteria bacterium]|nr:hypothetical protein [Ignavibacteria bacterium]